MSSIMAKTPGGVSGHVFAGGASDDKIFSVPGYQFGASGYTQAVSWLYGTRFPALIPGQSASTPFISANPWRGEGPIYFNAAATGNAARIMPSLGNGRSTLRPNRNSQGRSRAMFSP